MKELQEMKQNIDYTKTKLDERKSVISDTLDTDFLERYFDEYYQSNTQLAEENQVCKTLEQMANYLLASEEIKEQSKREKQEYKFYSDPLEFKKALQKETSLEKLMNSDNEENENVLHMLKKNEKNVKIVGSVKVNAKDLKNDDELSNVLNDYNDFIEVLDDKIKNGEGNRFVTTKIKGDVKLDMKVAKEQILGVFGDHFNPSESTKYDVSLFDLSNENHLIGMKFTDSKGNRHNARGLLFMKPTSDLTNDFNLLLIELQNHVKNANLTVLESEVAALLLEDISKKEIEARLDITSSKLRYIIKIISKKVVKSVNKQKKCPLKSENGLKGVLLMFLHIKYVRFFTRFSSFGRFSVSVGTCAIFTSVLFF